jgi:hypothetical protein
MISWRRQQNKWSGLNGNRPTSCGQGCCRQSFEAFSICNFQLAIVALTLYSTLMFLCIYPFPCKSSLPGSCVSMSPQCVYIPTWGDVVLEKKLPLFWQSFCL